MASGGGEGVDAVDAGSSGTRHFAHSQDVHEAESGKGDGSGEHCDELHFVEVEGVCIG